MAPVPEQLVRIEGDPARREFVRAPSKSPRQVSIEEERPLATDEK